MTVAMYNMSELKSLNPEQIFTHTDVKVDKYYKMF